MRFADKNREIPMDVLNPDIRNILIKLCRGKGPDDYVFTNPDTETAFTDVKRSFHTACRLAKIENLWWHESTRHLLHAPGLGSVRGANNCDLDGEQRFEDDHALH